MICEYGCGQEGKYQFKNGKWCCSKDFKSCSGFIAKATKNRVVWNKERTGVYSYISLKKMSTSHKNMSDKTKENISKSKKEYYYNNPEKRYEAGKKMREGKIGKPGPNLNKTFSREWVDHMSEGQKRRSRESRDRQREKMLGKPKTESFKNSQRIRMLNGGAHKALLGIKNPSGPELKLREIVKGLYPISEHTYKILNYDVDIAIIENKIAIEFDGYYHFDTEEHKVYHNKRQQEIEKEGWNFLRYNIFQKFPTLEQVKEDIQRII